MRRGATGPTCRTPRASRRTCGSARLSPSGLARLRATRRPGKAADADVEKLLSELGMAGVLPSPAASASRTRRRQFPSRASSVSLARRCSGARRLAARPHRLSPRRRRHAAAVGNRLDAQPGADGDGLVPDQASADRLARRRAVVLGHAGRCRPRQQSRQLAVGRRVRSRCRALSSASSIRCCQGEKFDPGGDYVRRFVPELGALDADSIHSAVPRTSPRSAERRRGARKDLSRRSSPTRPAAAARSPRSRRSRRPSAEGDGLFAHRARSRR